MKSFKSPFIYGLFIIIHIFGDTFFWAEGVYMKTHTQKWKGIFLRTENSDYLLFMFLLVSKANFIESSQLFPMFLLFVDH